MVTSTNELRFDDRVAVTAGAGGGLGRDHLDEICDDSEFTVPGGPADEMGQLFGTIMTG